MKKVLLTLTLLAASACAANNAIVSDFNGDSVTIVTNQLAADGAEARRNADAEANRICRQAGRNGAEFASLRENPNTYENFLLYLCL
jgi:hypothetical protein